jgi:hypothetical protein
MHFAPRELRRFVAEQSRRRGFLEVFRLCITRRQSAGSLGGAAPHRLSPFSEYIG